VQAQASNETFGENEGGTGGRLKRLFHEGNRRHVVVTQGERQVVDFPLTIGVIGAVLAPPLAALGVVVALITGCSIAVKRDGDD